MDNNKERKKSAHDIPWWTLVLALVIGNSIMVSIVYVVYHPLHGNIYFTAGVLFLVVGSLFTLQNLFIAFRVRKRTVFPGTLMKKSRYLLPLYLAFPVYFNVLFFGLAAYSILESEYSTVSVESYTSRLEVSFIYLGVIPLILGLVLNMYLYKIERNEKNDQPGD